ncbi:MAG: hypothetical protein V1661_00375 [bacterium]
MKNYIEVLKHPSFSGSIYSLIEELVRRTFSPQEAVTLKPAIEDIAEYLFDYGFNDLAAMRPKLI